MKRKQITEEQVYEALTAWMVIALVRFPNGMEQIETAYSNVLDTLFQIESIPDGNPSDPNSQAEVVEIWHYNRRSERMH